MGGMGETETSFLELQDWLREECVRQGRENVEFPSGEWKKGIWRMGNFPAGEGSHFVVDLNPKSQEVTVGFRTSGRYLNESIEQQIMDLADGSMEEFLQDGLDEVGLEGDYRVDHYRDEGEFGFTTNVSAQAREEIAGLLRAYLVVFEPLLQ